MLTKGASTNAAGEAACAALSQLGGELADRGCRWELLPGGTAPWLLVSKPMHEKSGAVVIAWAGWYWWPWGDHVGPYAEAAKTADRVAISLTSPSWPRQAGDPR
jgi:hypothetical protein